ncbi:SDR family oxidoreductase [Pedobacter metabolipauper]|uniref:Nucleoside-diphosphate-sugar epimerase n=1 Tax=Pedobacter metabolipauper TaxID=425513 RepID=A0A4R6SSZ3_9SPHI|nr:aldehyde reductase [Pedobacter metabolipauper]TDQ08108.1 nucleoside-diphosphate-sugar epimerase [Pedobacter metabolipauper]
MESLTKNQTVLVTGGTGFVGIYCILQLLQQGYTVKTTVRSLNRKQEVISLLQSAGMTSLEQLSFVEADLGADDHWNDAVEGCMYVLHVASPFPAGEPEDADELIIPARDGALRVLKAARNAGVKRVVLTSSFAAIGYSKDTKDHVFTELDWTDPEIASGAYIKSKTIAEMAAWDYMKNEGGDMELTVINPVAIFGPVMGQDHSTSVGFIKSLLEGHIKQTPGFTFGVVDVRDVAAIHLLAMTHPEAAGERFLATASDVVSIYDIAQFIKKERPAAALNIAELEPLDPSAYTAMSNEKAKRILGWKPRSKEAAILASVDSLVI